MTPSVVLLGPQRPQPNLAPVLDAHQVGGPVVAVTAGWRSDEQEVGPLAGHVGRGLEVLPLYAWFEELSVSAPEVARAWAARQTAMKAYKRLHRIRLTAAVAVVRDLWQRLDRDPLVSPVLDRAVAALRQVDADALQATDDIRARYPEVDDRFSHPEVAARRDEVVAKLDAAAALLMAGGNVGVLRNRLMFFGVEQAIGTTPVFAWGGGAMVTSARIVLFYDDGPEGPREAEVLDRGLGLVQQTVWFPHARLRLNLASPSRVAALARRFGPDTCIGLENGAWLERSGDTWRNRGRPGSAFVFDVSGVVVDLPGVQV